MGIAAPTSVSVLAPIPAPASQRPHAPAPAPVPAVAPPRDLIAATFESLPAAPPDLQAAAEQKAAALAQPQLEVPALTPAALAVTPTAPTEPYPAVMPTGLREKFAAEKAATFFTRLPSQNWGKTTAVLNLRDRPGTGSSQKLGQLAEGARVAVIASQKVDGHIWHKVVPFDCDQLSPIADGDPAMTPEDPCNQAYWVAGSYIAASETPNPTDIAAHPTPQAYTEAGLCQNCGAYVSEINGPLEELGEEIQAGAAEAEEKSLFEDYSKFQQGFLSRHSIRKGQSLNQWARKNKALFIDEMIETLGLKRANEAILALTAFGEARGAGANRGLWENMAEMSTVITIINNRAHTNYYVSTNLVDDDSTDSLYLRAALADHQFSAWNSNDNNLGVMMFTSASSVVTSGDDAALKRAFDVLELMKSGEIKPLGRLAEANTRHYHTPNLLTDWSRGRKGLRDPQVLTPGGVVTIRAHSIFQGI
jgi:hypothetical protein